MVSVALLFALLETNPPPFCLLDEVDAALDEAKIGIASGTYAIVELPPVRIEGNSKAPG